MVVKQRFEVRETHRVAILVFPKDELLAVAKKIEESPAVTPRGEDPDGFENSCLADAVLSGQQRHAAEVGKLKVTDASEGVYGERWKMQSGSHLLPCN